MTLSISERRLLTFRERENRRGLGEAFYWEPWEKSLLGAPTSRRLSGRGESARYDVQWALLSSVAEGCDSMTEKIVFISYSHDSEGHRERVLALSERLRTDGIRTRLDQYLNGEPDQGWPRWMLDMLDKADAVLVVCTETYYRRFRGHEVPGVGKGVDWEGALITQELYDAHSKTRKFVPVMLESVGDPVPIIPEPLRSRTYYTLTSEGSYQALYDVLLEQAGVEPGAVGTVKKKPRRAAAPATFDEAPAEPAQIAVSRLTHGAAKLFGRADDLVRLDAAWEDPKIHLVTLVAWGGVGKTSLVAGWGAQLAARDYDGARYFDWSFYSQGTREVSGPSSGTFVAAALKFFGDVEMAESTVSAWDKGVRLAHLVAARRTLLVLDGLEPMQHPPGPLAGELKDPAVTALLKGLAASNRGLCVVTTRQSVKNLESFREPTAPEWKLRRLSTTAGVELLKSLGVHGAEGELVELVQDVAGHALTLNLLGQYLSRAHGGDVRRRDRVKLEKADLKTQGGHAFRVMAAYESWLAEGGEDGVRQLAVLRLLGLFDRPADAGCLAALRRDPVIDGLTEPLVGVGEDDWSFTVSLLADCGLISSESSVGSHLDAHPLIREYFGRQLRKGAGGTWRAAHGRLFDYLLVSTEHQPDSLEGLQPLYQAVRHGCEAGRQGEVCDGIYRNRIQRGQEFYSMRKIGAFGDNLGAIACFFDAPWSRVSHALTEADQAWLLHDAAFCLRALGRLTEAVEPMRASLQTLVEQENWKGASIIASNLSELELTVGDMHAAIHDAGRSVVLADRSGDIFDQMDHRTVLADTLNQAGRPCEAIERFREAEEMQAERQPANPLIYSQAGFRYCDLLLANAERAAWRVCAQTAKASRQNTCPPNRDSDGSINCCRVVAKRAALTLPIAERNNWILNIALDHLTLGRVGLYRTILEHRDAADAVVESAIEKPKAEIEQAVDGLRRAGQLDDLPNGLITRAWLRSLTGDAEGAVADLDEAWEIAERGPMPLFQADVQLHRARLFLDRDALAEARRLIDKHGYGRRLEELADAERASKDWYLTS